MPIAWILSKTLVELAGAFQAAGWDVKAFAWNDFLSLGFHHRKAPDVIVFAMADETDFEPFRKIHGDRLAPVLTLVSSPAFAEEAFAEGANDVVVMPANPIELLVRARRLAHTWHVIHVGDLVIDLAGHVVKRREQLIELSPIEFRLLAFLAKRIGEVVSHDEILAGV